MHHAGAGEFVRAISAVVRQVSGVKSDHRDDATADTFRLCQEYRSDSVDIEQKIQPKKKQRRLGKPVEETFVLIGTFNG